MKQLSNKKVADAYFSQGAEEALRNIDPDRISDLALAGLWRRVKMGLEALDDYLDAYTPESED